MPVSDLFPDNIVSAVDPHLWTSLTTGNVWAANQLKAVRVVCPVAGTLTDLAICVGTQSGNISVGVYDTNGDPQNRLFTTGAIACPAAGWTIVAAGSLGVTVTAGKVLDLAVSADNAVIVLNGANGTANVSVFPAPYYTAGGAVAGRATWGLAGGHPLPATVSDAAKAVSGNLLPLMARIV